MSIVDIIGTIKISAPQSRQMREVCTFIAPKAHDSAELQICAPKAQGMCSKCDECAQTLNALLFLKK